MGPLPNVAAGASELRTFSGDPFNSMYSCPANSGASPGNFGSLQIFIRRQSHFTSTSITRRAMSGFDVCGRFDRGTGRTGCRGGSLRNSGILQYVGSGHW